VTAGDGDEVVAAAADLGESGLFTGYCFARVGCSASHHRRNNSVASKWLHVVQRQKSILCHNSAADGSLLMKSSKLMQNENKQIKIEIRSKILIWPPSVFKSGSTYTHQPWIR